MPSFFRKILNILNRETKAQDESKTLAVLIRSSSVFVSLNMVVLSIYSIFRGDYSIMALYFGILATLCYAFYITYVGSVPKALWLMELILVTLAVVGTCLYSWGSYFHAYLYFNVLAFFFYTKMSVRFQAVTALSNVVLLLILAFGRRGKIGYFGAPEFVYALNILTFVGLVMSVGYSFASKFARTEYKLYQYNIQLKKLAGSDPLTGLMNRRNMLSVIEETIPMMTNGEDMMSVAIGDIDFFKKVNDSRGHDCGDYVLKELSSLFNKYMEPRGYAARWGGEEFLFVFIHGNADLAYVDLEDLRNLIEKKNFEFADHEFKITMTFGLEEHNINEDIEETIKKADEKLYMGKESGRNKVVY